MFIAQFGSNGAWGFRPVWLGAIANLNAEENPEAKATWGDLPYGDFQPDGYGRLRAPAAIAPIDVSGSVFCGRKRTQAEWEREVRRHVGLKDWLVGYRSLSCRCDAHSPPLRTCNVCGLDNQVEWFARRARLLSAAWSDNADTGARWGHSPNAVALRFESDTHWLKMTRAHWVWGVPNPAGGYLDTGDRCRAPEIDEMAWPCNVRTLIYEPPFRWFYRQPADWTDTYCVANWTAGRWIEGHVGTEDEPGEATVHVMGDTSPLSRLAFTNFSWLVVEICSPSGQSCRMTFDAEWIGEPQYLLVDPRFGAEVRYCPLGDDACLAVPGAEHAAIAENGSPYPVGTQTCPLVGQLYPGRNLLRFWGFRLPGRRFHWSYDIANQFV